MCIRDSYRTSDRMESLIGELESLRDRLGSESLDKAGQSIMDVEILGAVADGIILGLQGPRALCSSRGIEQADVVLVPLEDGDRCKALTSLGKQVIAIDLNPLSRTSKSATVKIVDDVNRAMSRLADELLENPTTTDWDNEAVLRDALDIMSSSSLRID